MPVSTQQMTQILEEVERSVPDLLGVYRVGSSGTPSERSNSDLDLAILAAKPLGGRPAGNIGLDLRDRIEERTPAFEEDQQVQVAFLASLVLSPWSQRHEHSKRHGG